MFYWSPELWNQAVDLAAAYWIVPVGLVALAFYGSYHFNTPDYALAAERAGSEDLPWNAPTSKLRGLAPPLFTTSRTQYRRYEASATGARSSSSIPMRSSSACAASRPW